jgi:hypothetical protein
MPTTQHDQYAAISELPHDPWRGSDVETPAHFVTQFLVDIGRRGHARMLTETFA